MCQIVLEWTSPEERVQMFRWNLGIKKWTLVDGRQGSRSRSWHIQGKTGQDSQAAKRESRTQMHLSIPPVPSVTEPFHFKVFFWWCPIKGLTPTCLAAAHLAISVMRTWGSDKDAHGGVSAVANRWVQGVAKSQVHPSFIHINSPRCLCKSYPVGPIPCLFNSILPFLSLVSAEEQSPLLARYNPVVILGFDWCSLDSLKAALLCLWYWENHSIILYTFPHWYMWNQPLRTSIGR